MAKGGRSRWFQDLKPEQLEEWGPQPTPIPILVTQGREEKKSKSAVGKAPLL